jgi:hypothetical protein
MVLPAKKLFVGEWMKLTIAAVLVLILCANQGWAQTNETESLKLQVEQQGKQIEELQQKLARLERALLGGVDDIRTSLEPVAKAEMVTVPAFEAVPRQSQFRRNPRRLLPSLRLPPRRYRRLRAFGSAEIFGCASTAL